MAYVTITVDSDSNTIMRVTQQANVNSLNVQIIDLETNTLIHSVCYNTTDLVEFAHLIIKQYGS